LAGASWLSFLVLSITARGRGLGGCRLLKSGDLMPRDVSSKQAGTTDQVSSFRLICTVCIMPMVP